MGNPYAPLRYGVTEHFRIDSPEPLIERLRALGATEDEREAVRTAWGNGGYTDDEKRSVMTLGDQALARSLDDVRREHYEGTHTPEEEEADRAEIARREATVALRSNSSIPDVLAWVGGNLARAQAVANLERGSDKPRVGLLTKLDALIGA